MPDLTLSQTIAILVGTGGGVYFTIRMIVRELRRRWQIMASPRQVRRAIDNPPEGVRFDSTYGRKGELKIRARGQIPQPPEPESPPSGPGYDQRLL